MAEPRHWRLEWGALTLGAPPPEEIGCLRTSGSHICYYSTFMVAALGQCKSVCPAGTVPSCLNTAAEHALVTRYTKGVEGVEHWLGWHRSNISASYECLWKDAQAPLGKLWRTGSAEHKTKMEAGKDSRGACAVLRPDGTWRPVACDSAGYWRASCLCMTHTTRNLTMVDSGDMRILHLQQQTQKAISHRENECRDSGPARRNLPPHIWQQYLNLLYPTSAQGHSSDPSLPGVDEVDIVFEDLLHRAMQLVSHTSAAELKLHVTMLRFSTPNDLLSPVDDECCPPTAAVPHRGGLNVHSPIDGVLWFDQMAKTARRHPSPNHTWVEVSHCGGSKHESRGAFHYVVRGSGLFVNTGATLAFRYHEDASIYFLDEDCGGRSRDSAWDDLGQCDDQISRFVVAARDAGWDSLQFTNHCDAPCNECPHELVLTHSSGTEACPPNATYRMGPGGSEPCECKPSTILRSGRGQCAACAAGPFHRVSTIGANLQQEPDLIATDDTVDSVGNEDTVDNEDSDVAVCTSHCKPGCEILKCDEDIAPCTDPCSGTSSNSRMLSIQSALAGALSFFRSSPSTAHSSPPMAQRTHPPTHPHGHLLYNSSKPSLFVPRGACGKLTSGVAGYFMSTAAFTEDERYPSLVQCGGHLGFVTISNIRLRLWWHPLRMSMSSTRMTSAPALSLGHAEEIWPNVERAFDSTGAVCLQDNQTLGLFGGHKGIGISRASSSLGVKAVLQPRPKWHTLSVISQNKTVTGCKEERVELPTDKDTECIWDSKFSAVALGGLSTFTGERICFSLLVLGMYKWHRATMMD